MARTGPFSAALLGNSLFGDSPKMVNNGSGRRHSGYRRATLDRL